eukprot:COSAG02_NODE_57605_length_280_cov_0.569061_2_plen_56_part_01
MQVGTTVTGKSSEQKMQKGPSAPKHSEQRKDCVRAAVLELRLEPRSGAVGPRLYTG